MDLTFIKASKDKQKDGEQNVDATKWKRTVVTSSRCTLQSFLGAVQHFFFFLLSIYKREERERYIEDPVAKRKRIKKQERKPTSCAAQIGSSMT